MNNNNDGLDIQLLYEGDLYSAHRIEEDGEVEFSINLFGTVTVHFDLDEWNEFLDAMHSLNPED
ncbi:MAG TPA: hypothetical protein VJZ27_07080 [Aggregatilineales bacterium]|nr:hypothetical protein [Aggregatilineales bacterium]